MNTKTNETPAADDFDAAFSSFSTPGSDVDTSTAEAPAAVTEENKGDASGGADGAGSGDATAVAAGSDGGADGGAGDGGAGGEAAPAAADDKGGEAAPAATDDKTVATEAKPAETAGGEPNPDDVLARLSKLVAAAKPAEAAPAAVDKKEEEAKPLFTEEQQNQLAQYDKDWPDVAKYEAMKRGAEYKELMGYIFSEVQKFVAPLQQMVDSLAGRTHLQDVKGVVPDYSDNLREQVVNWVKTQPTYLQTAYDHVINNGTVDEVKDLVDRYRQATGQAAPAAGAAPTGDQGGKPAKDNELSGAAKEAAAALAPVESKRSEVITSSDPSTFEDAWSQFAKDLA